ncbi:hypothetical protein [Streptomyces sp. NBC_00306]|uniref:hypothetical protein n=1 Tax=Streptomyces sp. NBC_00306 TaxID=2975708 RepID=UPI002E2B74FA|nr:hypothetical protein [Streptomyces sp. NBC_00306]
MSVTVKSARGKIFALAAVLLVAAVGLGVWLWAGDDKEESTPLSAPAKPCWDGTPSHESMQKLLGPGKQLILWKSPYEVIKDHSPTRCNYDVQGANGVEPLLSVYLSWHREPPKASDLPVPGAGPGDKVKEFDAGMLAYYLRATNRLYFQCDVDQPTDAADNLRNDKYVRVEVAAHPMDSAHLTAKQAREVGLDMVLEVAHKVAGQAGCTNDTNLPKSAPQVDEPNWPRFH